MDVDDGDAAAQVTHCFGDRLRGRAHDDDDVLRVWSANVFKWSILVAREVGEAIHRVLHNGGTGEIEGVARFASLEVHIGVLRRAAHDWSLGRKPAESMGPHEIVVDQSTQVLIGQKGNLGHLVRGAEAVEEVDEWHTGLQRGHLCDQREVVHLLRSWTPA
jgi:hypothetical protein